MRCQSRFSPGASGGCVRESACVPDRNRNFVGRLEVLLLCASSGRRVRKRDVRLLSSDRGRGFPTRRVELAGGGQVGRRASLHRAASPDGPMRPKEARTKRGEKQRRCSRGREGENKTGLKKQKKGDYNATLQPWREQTATVKVSPGPDYYLHT